MADEYNNKAIAVRLKVTTRKVTGIRERLLKKTKTINGIGLVIWAIKKNIIKI
jgi:DNA-binding NarL/FixJ family response regulator